MQDYIIEARSGVSVPLAKGGRVTIIDLEGKQVVDFFAVVQDNPDEFLSAGVTIDCNDCLKVRLGDTLYTNQYRTMFRIVEDTVQEHDLLHPCCRPEMYEFFYHSSPGHANCLDNLNSGIMACGMARHAEIRPFNIFMHTAIQPDGRITVEEPKTKPGDRITLEAEMDVTLFIAACSVSESKCNGGKCTPVKVLISNHN